LASIRTLFWDVGGVLLTNAWDHTERAEALAHFKLDGTDFQGRHEAVVDAFERGEVTLDEYLERTVFYLPRPFTREEFRAFMFPLSKSLPGMLEFAQKLSDSGRYFMGTINNESRELNLYRIEQFVMRKIFRIFISSCFVGLRKPGPEIYRLALEVTQMKAEECCFIDDRAENLETPAKMGMKTIQRKSLEQLTGDLEKLGISV
jgi:putative hydrolase of the HAD superfamily